MSTVVGDKDPFGAPVGEVPLVRIPRPLRVSAAHQLVSDEAGPRATAARRFVDAAPGFGIDLSLMWGTLDRGREQVRQVCLAVIGTGRTAMLFVSGQPSPGRTTPDADRAERIASIQAACEWLAEPRPKTGGGIRLVQALLEREESQVADALGAAGFTRLGDLAYLRLARLGRARPFRRDRAPVSVPDGVIVRAVASLPRDLAEEHLIRALERTYVDTLDCPELCGLREASDILASHRAVGEHDPNLWWLVYEGAQPERGGTPEGCALFNPCADLDTIELVYIGVSPALRGRSLGKSLLTLGLERVASCRQLSVTCAVDTRNAPALRMYEQAGFERMSVRVPFVRALRPRA